MMGARKRSRGFTADDVAPGRESYPIDAAPICLSEVRAESHWCIPVAEMSRLLDEYSPQIRHTVARQNQHEVALQNRQGVAFQTRHPVALKTVI